MRLMASTKVSYRKEGGLLLSKTPAYDRFPLHPGHLVIANMLPSPPHLFVHSCAFPRNSALEVGSEHLHLALGRTKAYREEYGVDIDIVD